MINIFTYSKLSEEQKTNKLLNELYNVTKIIEKDYPNHNNWFFNKFVKELDGIKREIVFCTYNNKVVGVAFLKKDNIEKKICTIMVDDKYRKMGIGSQLLINSFDFLETTKPLISMPDYKEKCFSKIIEKFKWVKTQVIDSYYSSNQELVFNGYLK